MIALLRALPFLLLAPFALAFVASSWLGILRGRWELLSFDPWRIHDAYFRIGSLSAVLYDQNGHRPVIPGLLYKLDLHCFGATNLFLVVIGLASITAGLAVASWLVWQDREIARRSRAAAIGFLWIAVFWLGNNRNLVHGNEVPFVGLPVLLIAVAGCGLHRIVRPAPEGRAGPAWGPIAATAGACWAASFCHGVGLGLSLAVVVAALILRAPRRAIIALSGSAAATFAIYFFVLPRALGERLPPNQPSFAMPGLLWNALNWLGAPIVHTIAMPGEVHPWSPEDQRSSAIALGAVTASIALGMLVISALRPRRASPCEPWALLCVLIGGGMALQVAILRQQHLELWPQIFHAGHYLIWICLLWSGLFALAAGRLGLPHSTPRVHAKLWIHGALALLLGCAFVPTQLRAPATFQHFKVRILEASLGVALDVEDPVERKTILFHDLELIRRVAAHLRSQELAMFRWPESKLIGSRIEEQSDIAAPEPLHGRVDAVEPIASQSSRGARFHGWAIPRTPSRSAVRVLAVAPSGIVAGAARFTRPHPKLAAAHRFPDQDALIGFRGYIKDYDPALDYRFFVVLEGESIPVEIRAPARPRAP
ncbi:MAG: hypothetical protein IPN34_06780 [Planctomycetes bacterium]|nr:hypothetical protein [Planctomycetota bacterium]